MGDIDLSLVGPAFLAGLLVLSTHVPLGRQVLQRGIIFLDLAVAHIAGLGVIVAFSVGWQSGGWQVQAVAMSAAFAGALLLYLTEKYLHEIQEAVIGCVFVLAASGGILVLNADPHGGEALKDLLAGQILWVNYDQLLPVALGYGALLALWYAWRKTTHPLLFYVIFAVAITISVQLVGIFLVFASLIMPSLAAWRVTRFALLIAYGAGVAGYGGGLALSVIFDLPAGAAVVWALALVTAVVLLFRRVISKRVA